MTSPIESFADLDLRAPLLEALSEIGYETPSPIQAACIPHLLAGHDLLSWQVFKSAREREIEGFRYPQHLMPISQFYSAPNGFAQLGSGNGMQPFQTVQDYENFLKRVDGFVAWVDQAIVNMREGVQKGYTIPRVLAERVLPQLAAHVVANPEDSIFFGPVICPVSAVDFGRGGSGSRWSATTALIT